MSTRVLLDLLNEACRAFYLIFATSSIDLKETTIVRFYLTNDPKTTFKARFLRANAMTLPYIRDVIMDVIT